MITKLGIYALLAGIFVGLFNAISQFMGSKNIWIDLTISKIIGKEASLAIVDFIPVLTIRNSLDYLIFSMPFFIFLLGLSIILLIISMFVKNH